MQRAEAFAFRLGRNPESHPGRRRSSGNGLLPCSLGGAAASAGPNLYVARDRGSDDRLGCGQRLAASDKWSVLTRTSTKLPEGYVELGELCRVHRDAVTGTNRGQTECGCKGTRLPTFPSGSFSQAWRRPANCSRLEKADFRGRFAQRHRPSVRP